MAMVPEEGRREQQRGVGITSTKAAASSWASCAVLGLPAQDQAILPSQCPVPPDARAAAQAVEGFGVNTLLHYT